MKKLQFNPLQLDKETIARLDEQQLKEIAAANFAGDVMDTCPELSCISSVCHPTVPLGQVFA